MKNKIKKEWKKLFESCSECRKKRKDWKKEKNEEGYSCPPFPGCGKFEENIDILLLTQGHAGGGKEDWDKKDFDELTSMKKRHYLDEKPIPSFHSFAIRRIIRKIKKIKKSWYLTDIWKCFVYNDEENKKISFEYCKKFLIKEIEILKPKIIVLFGGKVRKFFEKIEGDLKHKKYELIDSTFPARWTADIWLKNNREKELIDKIKKIL